MSPQFSFEVMAQDKSSRARIGIIYTAHGNIETPYLIPVATRGHIVALSTEDIEKLNIQALLANTYHLHLKPGDKKIKSLGGIHNFMKFQKPIFTDSGGFQAFSLGLGRQTNARKIGFLPGEKPLKQNADESYAKITEEGIYFISTYDDKSEHFIGPEESMKIQSNLGADIIMAFDECTSAGSDKKYIEKSMERSHRWELESLKFRNPQQALYGIIHGGWFKPLRIKSAQFVKSQNFDGIARGGSLGQTKKEMHEILDWIAPLLDGDLRPRHMLGIGWIDDIFECVERGIDTFDCVEMTRIARHGDLYISPASQGSIKNKFQLDIKKSKYKTDKNKIDKNCSCSTCESYNRSDIHKLIKQKSPEYARLATIHNVYFILNLMRQIRESIKLGEFEELKKHWLGSLK